MSTQHRTVNTAAEDEIRARIASSGRITFAEFQELALYHPNGGYYAAQRAVGAEGDYFTSPTAHPAFSALMAVQARRMWQLLGRPSPFTLVEIGAGGGLMARDLQNYASTLDAAFCDSLRYIGLERYSVDGFSVRQTPIPQRIVAETVPLNRVVGCVFSNELVDAFPVHRFEIQDGTVREVYVTAQGAGFTEVLGEPSTPLLERRLERLNFELPEGSRGEVNLGIKPWMSEVASSLGRGFVITVDYGFEARDLYSPERSKGTIQTYFRHTPGGSPYQRVGRQDITAFVDFSEIVTEGESVGLRPIALMSQARFLRSLGFDRMLERLGQRQLESVEFSANREAMLEIIKPEGLGGFKVLVQERDTGVEAAEQIAPASGDVAALEVPLLGPDHLPLMEGRFPRTAWELEHLWPPEEDWPGK